MSASNRRSYDALGWDQETFAEALRQLAEETAVRVEREYVLHIPAEGWGLHLDGKPLQATDEVRRLLDDSLRNALDRVGARQCREQTCRQWFKPRRSDAIYCSKRCADRVAARAYRRRKAGEIRQEGGNDGA